MTKGKYIVFEGINGCGKSTQVDLFTNRLSQNLPTYKTAEPTNGYVGKLLKNILRGHVPMCKHALPMLFTADTLDHHTKEDGLLQKLEEGTNVISDRSFVSTLAYQKDIIRKHFDVIQIASIHMLVPDILIYLAVPPGICHKRLAQRTPKHKLAPQNTPELKIIHKNYLSIIKKHQGIICHKYLIVEPTKNETAAETHKKLYQRVTQLLWPN